MQIALDRIVVDVEGNHPLHFPFFRHFVMLCIQTAVLFSCLRHWPQQRGQTLPGSQAFQAAGFRQTAAYLAFSLWPHPCLWWGISVHQPLTLVIASGCEISLGFAKYHGDTRTLSECQIRPWGFQKWLLAQASPNSLSVAASQDEAAGSLHYAANAVSCYIVGSAVVCFFIESFITFYKA